MSKHHKVTDSSVEKKISKKLQKKKSKKNYNDSKKDAKNHKDNHKSTKGHHTPTDHKSTKSHHITKDHNKSTKDHNKSTKNQETLLTNCGMTPEGLSRCSNQNITLAQRIVDLYTAGTEDSIKIMINLMSPDVILEVHDQTGTIPFAGNYLGHQGLTNFFSQYRQNVQTIDSYRGETFTNCEQTKIIVTVDTTQINQHENKTGKFCNKMFFMMSFNELGNIVRTDIYTESGPLVLFYASS